METREVIFAIKNNKSKELVKALYKIAFPPIVTFIRQKSGDRSDAEDCFQDALLALINKVTKGEYDEKYEVKNFLFVAARNIWFNKLQRAKKVRSADLQDFQLQDFSPQGMEVMIDDERKSAIQTLMNKAGERCKELLHLVLFEGKSLKEITSLMNFSSVDVTKTNHYRCKKKLKEELKGNPLLLASLRA